MHLTGIAGDENSLAWILSQPLFWAFLSVISGPCLFFMGFSTLYRKRQIMNIPRSTVRSAATGLVEVTGKAVGPYTVVSPLSKAECLYYRLVVVQDPEKKFSNRMREACAPLYVDDGTGLLMVYPANSELEMSASHQLGSLGQAMDGYRYGNDPEFVQEFSIRPGDQVFVLGTLTENRWTRKPQNDDITRIGPGFVSQAEADLLRCNEFEFLDSTRPSGEAADSSVTFDLHPPAILMKGSGPFLISSQSPRDVATQLGWKSVLYIWGGPIATIWGLWELLIVRPGWINSAVR
jgi:hypothetical protein